MYPLGLAKLIYTCSVNKLIIRSLFDSISKLGFNVEGTTVEAFPLFKVLSEHGDYVQRVEPSVQGGKKIAQAVWDALAR